jgi:hypothetical protein
MFTDVARDFFETFHHQDTKTPRDHKANRGIPCFMSALFQRHPLIACSTPPLCALLSTTPALRAPGWLFFLIPPNRAGQVVTDHVKHALQILKHETVFESQHTDVQFSQVFRPAIVILRPHGVEMPLAVEFHCQPALRAGEIQDVMPDAVLAAKLLTAHLGPLQTRPQRGFRGSQGASQLFAPGFQWLPVVDLWHWFDFTTL